MPFKEVSSDTVRSILSAFPEATPDTLVLVSRMLDDIYELKQKLLATQVMVVDLQQQLDTVRAVAIVAAEHACGE